MTSKGDMMTIKDRPDFVKLRSAAESARELAQRLFSNDVSGECSHIRYKRGCGQEASASDGCLERETKRLKGYPVLPRSSTLRSYSFFDSHKLCDSCAAYWHAEMLAQMLAKMVTLERMIAAEEDRDLPKEEIAP